LNAGVSMMNWTTTKDGFETTLQVNDLSIGLLAVLLLPLVQKTAKLPPLASSYTPHITLTGSEVHYWTAWKGEHEHPLEELNDKTKYQRADRYNVSKLINIFLAREIGKLAGNDVIVNVVNPGKRGGFPSQSTDLWIRLVPQRVNAQQWLLGSRHGPLQMAPGANDRRRQSHHRLGVLDQHTARSLFKCMRGCRVRALSLSCYRVDGI
jgi:NAD(P)-dependent dehydrogenase (short-subunit alcohol dehydrogenase family)